MRLMNEVGGVNDARPCFLHAANTIHHIVAPSPSQSGETNESKTLETRDCHSDCSCNHCSSPINNPCKSSSPYFEMSSILPPVLVAIIMIAIHLTLLPMKKRCSIQSKAATYSAVLLFSSSPTIFFFSHHLLLLLLPSSRLLEKLSSNVCRLVVGPTPNIRNEGGRLLGAKRLSESLEDIHQLL